MAGDAITLVAPVGIVQEVGAARLFHSRRSRQAIQRVGFHLAFVMISSIATSAVIVLVGGCLPSS